MPEKLPYKTERAKALARGYSYHGNDENSKSALFHTREVHLYIPELKLYLKNTFLVFSEYIRVSQIYLGFFKVLKNPRIIWEYQEPVFAGSQDPPIVPPIASLFFPVFLCLQGYWLTKLL